MHVDVCKGVQRGFANFSLSPRLEISQFSVRPEIEQVALALQLNSRGGGGLNGINLDNNFLEVSCIYYSQLLQPLLKVGWKRKIYVKINLLKQILRGKPVDDISRYEVVKGLLYNAEFNEERMRGASHTQYHKANSSIFTVFGFELNPIASPACSLITSLGLAGTVKVP